MQKYLTYKNLVVLLIIGLIGNNIALQIKLEEAIDAAQNAEYQARKAYNQAEDAYSMAEDAANYASDAADYARSASDNAENAYYSAQDAANNSFGRQCWSCP